jgi:hypothetical protein
VSTPNSLIINQYKYATSVFCHVSMMVRPSTWPYGLYGQVQSASPNFYLFDLAVKSRYLLHTDSVRENKYTTGIRKTSRTQWYWFRRILSTFIFEHFSCPDKLLNPISDHLASPRYSWLHEELLYKVHLYLSKQSKLISIVLSKLHATPTAGHLGFTKTYDRVKRSFF